MARNGAGVYSLPAGSTIVNGDLSDASDLNTPISDIAADLNVVRPIVAGGTGAASAAAALVNLGLAATAAEINILDGATLSVAELNVLDGIPGTLTATELGFVDGVTSAIQAQLDGKQASDTDLTALAALGPTDLGILDRTAAGVITPRSFASQAEAEAGVNTIAVMNPLRTAQAIAALSPGWTFVETIDCATGTTKDTLDFEIGRDYMFLIIGVSHADATTRAFQVAFFGETAAAFSAAVAFTVGVAPLNNQYGEYEIKSPRLSRQTHAFKGQRVGNTNVTTVNHLDSLLGGDGAYAHYAVAQGVKNLRFSIGNAAAFDGGSIAVYKR